jgi:Tol biopolymer transport system component
MSSFSVRTAVSAALTAALTALALPAASAAPASPAASASEAAPTAPRTERVSLGEGGAELPRMSYSGVLSADGNRVAFAYYAPRTESADVLELRVRDLRTGTVIPASTAPDGSPLDGMVFETDMSADGNHVVFATGATNAGDNVEGAAFDVFVRDLRGNRNELVNRGAAKDGYGGTVGGVSLSADARFVAYTADTLGHSPFPHSDKRRIYVYDRQTRTTVHASAGLTTDTSSPRLSADGRSVVFATSIPGDGTWPVDQLYRRDLRTGALERLDLLPDGTPSTGHSYSAHPTADGRQVFFLTTTGTGDTARTGLYVRDLRTRTTRAIDSAAQGEPGWLGNVTPDGRRIAFATGSGAWLKDLRTGRTQLISVASDGTPSEGNPTGLDARGTRVVFQSDATNLVPDDRNGTQDVFVRHLK